MSNPTRAPEPRGEANAPAELANAGKGRPAEGQLGPAPAAAAHPRRWFGIGSSDIYNIVAGSAIEAYNSITGLVERTPTDPNSPAHWGNVMEPVLLAEYQARHRGHPMDPIVERGRTCFHHKYPWARATPDGFCRYSWDDNDETAECKAWRDFGEWGDAGTDRVPMKVAIQVHWQLAVTGLNSGVVIALLNGGDYREYRIHRNDKIVEALLNKAGAFWNGHVLTHTPPPLDNSDGAKAWLQGMFPKNTEPLEADATDATMNLATALAQDKQHAKFWADQQGRRENEFKALIGDRDGLEGPWGKATWKQTARGRCDYKAVAAAMVPQGITKYANHALGCEKVVIHGGSNFISKGQFEMMVKDDRPCTCGFSDLVANGLDAERRALVEQHTPPGTRRFLFTPGKDLLPPPATGTPMQLLKPGDDAE